MKSKQQLKFENDEEICRHLGGKIAEHYSLGIPVQYLPQIKLFNQILNNNIMHL